jgi:capsular polysaccharide biosynthesis protein
MDFNLTYTLFADNPVPPLNVTMRWFHTAAMIVAPHGAGLSNMFFSRPGTYVVEGVCNIPHVNMCFQRLAQALGHRWHGVTSHSGCESVVSISAKEIDVNVRSLLTARREASHQ